MQQKEGVAGGNKLQQPKDVAGHEAVAFSAVVEPKNIDLVKSSMPTGKGSSFIPATPSSTTTTSSTSASTPKTSSPSPPMSPSTTAHTSLPRSPIGSGPIIEGGGPKFDGGHRPRGPRPSVHDPPFNADITHQPAYPGFSRPSFPPPQDGSTSMDYPSYQFPNHSTPPSSHGPPPPSTSYPSNIPRNGFPSRPSHGSSIPIQTTFPTGNTSFGTTTGQQYHPSYTTGTSTSYHGSIKAPRTDCYRIPNVSSYRPYRPPTYEWYKCCASPSYTCEIYDSHCMPDCCFGCHRPLCDNAYRCSCCCSDSYFCNDCMSPGWGC